MKTTTTELLISEYPNRKVFYINDIINKAISKAANSAAEYNIEFDIDNIDIRKILITNFVEGVCEFKKLNNSVDIVFIFNEEEYQQKMLLFIKTIFYKMEIFKKEKSSSFYRSFLKFLKQNGLTYLTNTYLKQATNKLALVR